MITDSNGDELVYWPITGLIEGEESEVLECTIESTGTGSLQATDDARVIVWAKRVADPSYQNISDTPYDLTGLTGELDFLVYVEAMSPITGLERVPISVVAGSGSSAGWTT